MARELITEHGDNVAAFLEAKIETLKAERDIEQLLAWFHPPQCRSDHVALGHISALAY